MEKSVLEQYNAIKKEIKDLERRIKASEQKIRTYEKKVVSDTVKGSRPDLTIGPIKITGLAQRDIDREHELNGRRCEKMQRFKRKLEDMAEEVEDYIQSIADSEIRRMARMRYLDGLEWRQVAVRMGKGYTGDSCRMKMERFIKNKSVRSRSDKKCYK